MKQFRLIDNVLGWVTFLIAAFVYCSTIEPTASFWDCPEFITTAYKLEVGHPPGAPFFMLTGNLFSQLTSDPTKVAYMVNMMSALMSALCILFLFWTITHLARKLVGENGMVSTLGQLIAVEASGLVGALACLAVLTIVMVCVTQISMKRDLSPEYQLDMAVKYRERGEYGRAIECYSRVMELRGEDAEILALLSDLYYLQNDSANYELTLRRILFSKNATQEQLHLAKDKLVILLIKKGDFDGINQMLMSEEDSELSEKYSMYLAPEPILDLKEGAYEGIQSLRISCAGKGKIYYTLDGTIPGENSAEYTLPVILDYGDVVVKACMINEYGVKSKIVQANYQIQRPLEIPQ